MTQSAEKLIDALRAYHSAYSDYRFAPNGSWEQGDASARLEEAYDTACAALAAQPASPGAAMCEVSAPGDADRHG